MTFGEQIVAAFGADRVRRDAPLAALTTFKVGGPADWLIDLHDRSDLARALALAGRAGVAVTVLGGGSNVLIGDGGVRGLVIRVHGGGVSRVRDDLVRADAGVTVNGLVRWTISRGLGGLEAWAGTPGTVGGAVFGNAHFQRRMIGDLIETVGLVSRQGVAAEVPAAAMEFAYDYSRLHLTHEVVVWADFRVGRGEPARLREAARASLRYRKETQPLQLPSAGCAFQNPDPAQQRLPPGIPASAGALIDRAGLKGVRVGGAMVSPTHANFIVNAGGATAMDVRTLIDRCKQRVRARFGVTLREEIVYVGDFGPSSEYGQTAN
jgi:UDP-N-acetylmuramate dehydrogenase